jgi:hypothetical protein
LGDLEWRRKRFPVLPHFIVRLGQANEIMIAPARQRTN